MSDDFENNNGHSNQPGGTDDTPPDFDPNTSGNARNDRTDVGELLRRELASPHDAETLDMDIDDRPPSGPLPSFGRYESQREIGRGGQGVVILARDPDSGENVAIKAMLPEHASSPQIRKEFIKNAHHLHAMRHENVMPVLDIGEDVDVPYMVMPFVEGGSLADKAKSGRPVKLERLLPVAIQVAKALEYAHDKRGVIHRDIKPDNVLIERTGHAYLCDFGLVKTVFNDSIQPGQRPIGWTVGTRPYMAPEVVEGNAGDMRVDIYSFGAMLYQLVTGRVPYMGNDTAEIFAKIKLGPPPPVQQLNPELPDEWALVIETAMGRELDDRYAHISHMLADLERIKAQEPPRGRNQTATPQAQGTKSGRKQPKAPPGTSPKPKDEAKKKGGGLLFAVVLLAIVGGGVAAVLTGVFDGVQVFPNPEPEATPEANAEKLAQAIRNSNYGAIKTYAKELDLLAVDSEFLQANNLVSPLLQAAQKGDLQLFEALLEVKTLRIFGVHGPDGLEPIHLAAKSGHADIVKLLVEKYNIPIDRESNVTRSTALQEAMAAGRVDVMRTLVELGADLNTPTGVGGNTALHLAVRNGELAAAENLLQAGANVDPRNDRRQTPLHLAALDGDEAMIGLLLRFNADRTAKDMRGKTAADLAYDEGFDSISEQLSP